MHKKFYASGFLYNPTTEQILLQQHKSSSPLWSLFGGKNNNDEEPIHTFSRTIFKDLKIKITSGAIHPVYDYLNKKLNNHCYIFYAEVDNSEKKNRARQGYIMAWFTFKQIYKLPVEEQTRQDIMVGKRVIDAVERSKASNILGVDKRKTIVLR